MRQGKTLEKTAAEVLGKYTGQRCSKHNGFNPLLLSLTLGWSNPDALVKFNLRCWLKSPCLVVDGPFLVGETLGARCHCKFLGILACN